MSLPPLTQIHASSKMCKADTEFRICVNLFCYIKQAISPSEVNNVSCYVYKGLTCQHIRNVHRKSLLRNTIYFISCNRCHNGHMELSLILLQPCDSLSSKPTQSTDIWVRSVFLCQFVLPWLDLPCEGPIPRPRRPIECLKIIHDSNV